MKTIFESCTDPQDNTSIYGGCLRYRLPHIDSTSSLDSAFSSPDGQLIPAIAPGGPRESSVSNICH